MTDIEVKEIIREIGGQELEIIIEIKNRKMACCGHIIHAGGLQSLILLGKSNGKRGCGKSRKT